MKKKNEMLKAAFEEAASKELEQLPAEDKVIRPYSPDFRNRMNKLLNAENKTDKKQTVRFSKVAVIAAVIAMMMCTFTASAFIIGDGIWKYVDLTPDPENYETIDITAEDMLVKEGEFDTLIYKGEPVTLRYTIDTGESWEWPDKGIMIFLDGVRQNFDARVNGEVYKNVDMLTLENEQGAVRSIDLTFEPNIGNKGDEMFLDVMAIFDPDVDYYPQCKSEHKTLFVGHCDDDNDSICDKCSVNIDEIPSGPSSYTRQNETIIKVIMEKDAPVQTDIADNFSAVKISELNKRIYKSYEYEDSFGNIHNDYDTMQSVAASVYKNIKDSYITEWGVECHATRIKTKAKENDEFTINLHGATGEYRVSFYINNEIQSVFDDSAYADVNVIHGKQTELTVAVDTTRLPEGDNYCYVLLQRLGGDEDYFRQLDCFTLDYTIDVK